MENASRSQVYDFDAAATTEPHAHWKASLQATNRAGLRSVTRAALPFLYDPYAPDVATARVAVCDVAGDRIAYQLSQDTLGSAFRALFRHAAGYSGTTSICSGTNQTAPSLPSTARCCPPHIRACW